MAEAARRSVSRRDLARHQHFNSVSPEVGELDENAFRETFEEDEDQALAMLVEMAAATDEGLKRLARALAGRILIDLARVGEPTGGGAARLVPASAERFEGDLDLDRSMEQITAARAGARVPLPSELTVRTWRKPDTALCLLIDRSGSMQGGRLASAALSAAAALFSKATDCSVIAFADDSIVLKGQLSERTAGEVVGDLLALRGSGVTNLAGAMRAARAQLTLSNATRKVTLVLSDCRVTAGGDAFSAASLIDEILILAPAGDSADAEEFASRIGARWAKLDGASSAPAALNQLLGVT